MVATFLARLELEQQRLDDGEFLTEPGHLLSDENVS